MQRKHCKYLQGGNLFFFADILAQVRQQTGYYQDFSSAQTPFLEVVICFAAYHEYIQHCCPLLYFPTLV